MSYEVKVLADSVGPVGIRLTTLQCKFPRFILAEVNTHRVFSRNSASSRAIPPEKLIQAVKDDPFVPATFNQRVKGMGVGEPLDVLQASMAESHWMQALADAIHWAEKLNELNVDKSRINRLLEPFMWHTSIISATEWSNFFALRNSPEAQPEFQRLAFMMEQAMRLSTPQEVKYGKWHLPLVTDTERGTRESSYLRMVSAGRCAKVSYGTLEVEESGDASFLRAQRLLNSRHLSPFEHQAMPHDKHPVVFSNFRGWVQFRKMIPHESDYSLEVAHRD